MSRGARRGRRAVRRRTRARTEWQAIGGGARQAEGQHQGCATKLAMHQRGGGRDGGKLRMMGTRRGIGRWGAAGGGW